MIFTVKKIFQCLLTPRLYNVHRSGPIDSLYKPRKTEEFADMLIQVTTMLRNVTLYMTPFIGISMYMKGLYTIDELVLITKFFGGVGCFLSFAFFMRAFGRARNPQYLRFLDALKSPKDDMQAYLLRVRRYDFDFQAWPATYVIPYNPDNTCLDRSRPFVTKENEHLPFYKKCIIKFLAYIAANTFALRVIYPGTLGPIQYMLNNSLVLGRASLVEEHNGERVKVITADGNSIDTMFVDYRKRANPNGKTLVICSEGNSGFYEIGIMATPMKGGYSTLGWNHPGFAGSTGLPYPRQEHNAIDAVMQYAIQVLKFQSDQIVMFGWSIGGYSAAWAACNYHTKALIIDATFDDLVPLAVNHMPASWESLVFEAVRSHIDLNVAEMTRHYRGPLHLIRRTDDEIICLRPGDISTNRGNELLLKVITNRHPEDVKLLMQVLVRFVLMPQANRPKLADPVIDASARLMLRLILKYSSDYKSSHCTPLPTDKFEGILNYIIETQKIND